MNLLVYFSGFAMIFLWHRTSSFKKKWSGKRIQLSFSVNSLPSSSSSSSSSSQTHQGNKEEVLTQLDQESIRKWYPVYKSSKLFGGHYTIIECPQPSDFSVLDHAYLSTSTLPVVSVVETYSASDSTTDPLGISKSISQSINHDSKADQVELHLSQSKTSDSGISSSTSSLVPQKKNISSVGRIMTVHPEEIEFGRIKEEQNLRRANIFIGGRIALRSCLTLLESSSSDLDSFHSACPPILTNEFGAPLLPDTVSGSVSHKGYLAVGITTVGTEWRVGVDIEKCHNKACDRLYQRILTTSEQSRVGRLVNVNITPEEEVMLLFSFKEAVYKAIHPSVRRPVGFQEVSITVLDNGTATFQFE